MGQNCAKSPTSQMRDAALIQMGSKYASIAVQLLVTAVLARLISPEEFGSLAIITVFTTFFMMFSDMGIGVAIVQFRDLDERDFGKLFGFSCILALALAALFCVAALPISVIYGDAQLVPLCCMTSFSLLLSTLNMVPNGLMLRRKKFAQIGIRLVVATSFSGVAGIALALLGFGCYALVAQMIVSAAIVLSWNLISNPVRHISLHFMNSLRRVFSYSAYQFAFGLVNYFNRTLDNLLIGKFMGASALGYYDKAYKLTTYPMSSISSVIASVVQPFMAEHQDDAGRIFECWWRISKLLSLVGAAVAAAFFCCAEEIVQIMYGNQWAVSVPLFQALSVSVYAQMLGNPSGAFFQSLGRTDLLFRMGLINACITVIALLAGLVAGSLEVVSWFVAAAFCVQIAVIAHYLIRRAFGKSLACLRAFFPEIVSGILAAAVAVGVGALLPDLLAVQLVVKLAVVAAILLVAYAATGQLEHLRILFNR